MWGRIGRVICSLVTYCSADGVVVSQKVGIFWYFPTSCYSFSSEKEFGWKLNAYSCYFCPCWVPAHRDGSPTLRPRTRWTCSGDLSCRSAVYNQELVQGVSPVLLPPPEFVSAWASSARSWDRSKTRGADFAAHLAAWSLRDGSHLSWARCRVHVTWEEKKWPLLHVCMMMSRLCEL